MATKRLGRGLDELFGTDIDKVLDDISSSGAANGATNIPLNEIRPNPYQPRKEFDAEKLKELAASISEHGVFQPVLVRKSVQGYELVSGERRLRASKLAGKEDIPAIIVDFDDKDMMEVSLLENIQREDLTPIEEAEAYDQMVNKLDYTQEQLAKRLGKSRSNITNILRLLKLPKELQDAMRKGKLSYGHARALLAVEDSSRQYELYKRVLSEGLSVRQLEKLVAQKPKAKKEVKEDPYLVEVRRRTENYFGTSVEVKKKEMILHYNSVEDLNRILDKLGLLEQSLQED